MYSSARRPLCFCRLHHLHYQKASTSWPLDSLASSNHPSSHNYRAPRARTVIERAIRWSAREYFSPLRLFVSLRCRSPYTPSDVDLCPTNRTSRSTRPHALDRQHHRLPLDLLLSPAPYPNPWPYPPCSTTFRSHTKVRPALSLLSFQPLLSAPEI